MSNLVPAPSGLAASDAARLFVVFRVDGVDYALAASDVLQMESFVSATPVPGTQPFVRGIVQVRGRVVPVIDLRLRFGMAQTDATFDSRVVVAEKDGRAVALLADSAREVVRIQPSQERPPPQLVSSGGYVRSIVQLADRTILLLDFAKVIGEEPIDV